MCHEFDDDLELDLALARLLKLGEQEADELTRTSRTPIPNREPGRDQNMERETSEQPDVVPV